MPRIRPALAAQVAGHLDVADDGRALEGLQVLEGARGADRGGDVRPLAGDLVALQDDRALGGWQDAGDHVERRRLARAIGTDERHDLAGLDVQVEVVQRRDPAVALGEAADGQDRLPGRHVLGSGQQFERLLEERHAAPPA
jgi:hypothetical protein